MKANFNARRRSFMRAASATGVVLAAGPQAARAALAPADPWKEAQSIADKLRSHVKFPKVDFDVTNARMIAQGNVSARRKRVPCAYVSALAARSRWANCRANAG